MGSRRLTIIATIVVLAFATAACAPAQDAKSRPTEGSQSPPGRFVVSRLDKLVTFDSGESVAVRDARRALFGDISPLAVPLPDGSVLYNAFVDADGLDPAKDDAAQGLDVGDAIGRPSVRVRDSSGRDSLVADGAMSVAVSTSGRIAMFRSDTADLQLNVPYVGSVVVRDSLDGADEVWTSTPAKYTVLAWAGDSLIVQRSREDEERGSGELIALSGAGKERVLSDHLGLTAVSPDGTQLLLGGTSELGTAQLELVALDELGTATTSDSAVGAVDVRKLLAVGTGSWSGNHIAVAAYDAANPSAPKLLVLTARGNAIAESSLIDLGDGLSTVEEPYFTDNGGTVVGVVTRQPDTLTPGPNADPDIAPVAAPRIEFRVCSVRSRICTSADTGYDQRHQIGRLRNPSGGLDTTITLTEETR